MANQRGVACRAQGWKIHLCAAQLRQLVSPQHTCRPDPQPTVSLVVLTLSFLLLFFSLVWSTTCTAVCPACRRD